MAAAGKSGAVALADLGLSCSWCRARPTRAARLLETYILSKGVSLERLLELDVMRAPSTWSPAPTGLRSCSLCLETEIGPRVFCSDRSSPLAFSLDLVLIEPFRRPWRSGAQAFCERLQDESRINRRWEKLVA
jgi:hypothetical protein